jgi:hypothetical protein
MVYLISPTQALLNEIYETPEMDDTSLPVKIGIPVELKDGRFCVAHPFNEITIQWLNDYIFGIAGAEVIECDILPHAVKETEV